MIQGLKPDDINWSLSTRGDYLQRHDRRARYARLSCKISTAKAAWLAGVHPGTMQRWRLRYAAEEYAATNKAPTPMPASVVVKARYDHHVKDRSINQIASRYTYDEDTIKRAVMGETYSHLKMPKEAKI